MTISETVVALPEMRIFATGMTVEALLIATVFFLRDHILDILIKKKTKTLIFLHFMTRFTAFFAPIGLITLSNFNVGQYWWPHMTGAFTFFIATILYFICYDAILGILKKRPSCISITWVVLATLCIAFAAIGRPFGNNMTGTSQDYLISASSMGQYLAVVFLATKCLWTIWDIPNHGVRFTQKQ